jgi:ethanolamine utilization protein EutP (predicted NTPase)
MIFLSLARKGLTNTPSLQRKDDMHMEYKKTQRVDFQQEREINVRIRSKGMKTLSKQQ